MHSLSGFFIAGLAIAYVAVQRPFHALDSSVRKDVLTPEIDTSIETILADWNSPGGVGIAVVQKNEHGSWNVETKGYGVAKADVIIPEWDLSDPVASSESTIVDLVSHRTGLPAHDLISTIKYLRPSAEFRQTWQYSNIMYTVLAYIPEVLLKVPCSAIDIGNLADGFGRDGINKTEDVFGMGTPYGGEDGNLISGAGRVISNAKDMATWLQALLLEGKNLLNDQQIIPSASSKNPVPELAPVVYGGGQTASSYRGHNFIEHGGATPAFYTQITRFPFDNVGVAVLTNENSYGSSYKAKVVEAYEQELQRSVPRPVDPTEPSMPFSLEGEYHNPAYGPTVVLCGIPSSRASSSSCKDLIKEIPVRLPGSINASIPTFFARMDKEWVTHIRLQHFDGNLFNVSGFGSLPIITSNSTQSQAQRYWTYDASVGSNFTIGFAVDSAGNGVTGFGVMGGFWIAGPGVEGPVGKESRSLCEDFLPRLVTVLRLFVHESSSELAAPR
ncbi:beta-lactamase/transpeptidase-like protein [Gymnopus androsaceus JB14]|uniref:Beta-lactamase/transpeptidase-like protein n=1 Tax=Gymnopus androsaceus JB14 TaxID=1447944 RepID=A0A6A4H8W4_9AGAR|nr:beta-lactamase/transpeptidase-like protein [Gymnopus androsaceus JB14]